MSEKKVGYLGIVNPGSDEVIFEDFSFDDSQESINAAFIKIIDSVGSSNKEGVSGKIVNMGYLPSPFNNFTAFIDEDQFNPDTIFNMGFFGTPVYGPIAFVQVDINSENGDILPIQEDKKDELTKAISSFKKFEKDSGIYDSMIKTNKNEFLKSFIEEQTSMLEESTKDIKGENYDELQKAKKQLKDETGSTDTISENI